MNATRVLCFCVLFCLLTAIASHHLIKLRTFELGAQCPSENSLLARIEFYLKMATRHFLLIWTICRFNMAVAPHLQRHYRRF